jgi:hypothetical protein
VRKQTIKRLLLPEPEPYGLRHYFCIPGTCPDDEETTTATTPPSSRV